VLKYIKNIRKIILNFFFPQKCLGCRKENEILCKKCLNKIDYPSLLKYNNIFTATDYNDQTAKKAIWLLKYQGVKTVAEPLAELMYQRLEARLPLGSSASKWFIIPIPLSKKRLKKRGFNQSELIARHLTTKNPQKFNLCVNVLYKIKETLPQVTVKEKEKRLNNLKGSFEARNAYLIEKQNIILIDDVTTTGATISEARKILKQAGAKKIIAMVIARG
jgi:competence protein ComFC